MSAEIPREVATTEADRPHRYRPVAGALGAICKVCRCRLRDERHLAYERTAAASERQAAAEQLPREFG